MKLLLVAAVLAGVGWFTPQLVEGTGGPCAALEQRLRATLPGTPQLAAAVAAQTVKALEQMPHGGGCVAGWWKIAIESGLGEAPAAK